MAKDFTKQHIVPKRYLDRFGVKGEKEIIIGTRFLKNGKPTFFPASTNDVGYIKNYYDVTDKEDPKYWEHFFAREIDAHCGRDMSNIIATITLSQENAVVLSKHDKEVLSKVIVAQLMRIPESVDYVTKKIYPRVAKQIKDNLASTLPDFLLDKYGELLLNIELPEQYQKEVLLNHAFNADNFYRYCKIVQDGIWMVYVNTQYRIMPFVTSDNPVLVEGIGRTETGLFCNGIANPTTCIFYPLSPTIAVAIYSRYGMLHTVAEQYDGRKILLNEMKYIVNKNVKLMEQSYIHSFIPQPLFDIIDKKFL